MKKTVLFFLCLAITIGEGTGKPVLNGSRQEKGVFEEDNSTAGQILDYINEMRENPVAFYKKYLEDYIRENGRRFSRYYTSSLEKDMHSAGHPGPFKESATLVKTASYQAKYLKSLGGHTLTHDAPGLSFEQRMRQAGMGCAGENLYTGENRTPLQVVMDLLIDQGVSSLGHRKNLLSAQYQSIGIVVTGYPAGGYIVVMDFGCS